MRKKTKSKKIKQKQKQKQSQNVRQTVNVNLGNISKRRPQRRTGTRTAPMVTYQQMPIPLAPSVDFGKLEHTISSLQNNILHSINNRENNNLRTTPPVQQPAPRVNLGTQTPISSMVQLATQTPTPSIVSLGTQTIPSADDEEFARFIQTRDLTRSYEKIASKKTALEQADATLGAVRQTGIPEVEGVPLRGRPKKGTQIAEPILSHAVPLPDTFVSQNSTENLKQVKKKPPITPEPVLNPLRPEKEKEPKPQLTGELEATTPEPKKRGRPKGAKNKPKSETYFPKKKD